MTLCADLCRQLGFILEIVCANDAGFFHAICKRLFAIDVQAAIHRPIGDEGVSVIRRATNHRIEVLLFEALAPIGILFG